MLIVSTSYMLAITVIVFFIGLCGIVLNRKNTLNIIMSIELLLLSINLNLIALSTYLDDIVGQIFIIFVLTIAAAESAVGLAMIMSFFRIKGTIELESIKRGEISRI